MRVAHFFWTHCSKYAVYLIIICGIFCSLDPKVAVIPTSREVFETESVTFHCLSGGATPTVMWMLLGGGALPEGVIQEGDSLVINRTIREHSGLYKCRVSNAVGSVDSSALLTVFCEWMGMSGT